MLDFNIKLHRNYLPADTQGQKLFILFEIDSKHNGDSVKPASQKLNSYKVVMNIKNIIKDMKIERLSKVYPVQSEIYPLSNPIVLGDVEEEEPSVFLMETSVPGNKPGKVSLLQINLAYNRNSVGEISDMFKSQDIDIKIGFETSGKRQVAGSLDEVIEISNKIKDVYPIINFPKIVARSGGMLNSAEDFNKIIEKVLKFYPYQIYMQFAGLEYSPENVMRLAPIKKGDLRFEYLADVLLEHEYDSNVISVSPLLEHDAQYMRVILERLIEKKIEKTD